MEIGDLVPFKFAVSTVFVVHSLSNKFTNRESEEHRRSLWTFVPMVIDKCCASPTTTRSTVYTSLDVETLCPWHGRTP